MITVVLAAFDKKARAYCTPFFVSHSDLAVRSFKQAANTPGNQVHDHPEDFALFVLGTFNDETGNFVVNGQPVPLVEAIQLKKPIVVPPQADEKNLGEE